MKVTNSPGIYKIIYHDHSLFLLFRERARERDRKRERERDDCLSQLTYFTCLSIIFTN